MTAQPDLRIALIGYGLSGRVLHTPLIGATPGLRITTAVTANPERQAQAQHDIAGVRVVDDVDALWVEPDAYDVVVVASGTQAHVQHARGAIAAGKPTVVEKPMAPTASAARELVVAAQAAGVPLVPFHNRRWDSDFLTLQRLLQERTLGDVLRFESGFDRWRPDASPDAWRESLPS